MKFIHAVAIAGALGGSFGLGVVAGAQSWEVPVLEDGPTFDRVVQDSRTCDLRDREGFRKSDDGCAVAVGKGFRAGYHTVRDGWTIKDFVATLVLVNDNPGAIGEFYRTLHLNRYDGSLAAILWCKAPAMAAGESRAIACKPLSPQDPEPFDEVRIS